MTEGELPQAKNEKTQEILDDLAKKIKTPCICSKCHRRDTYDLEDKNEQCHTCGANLRALVQLKRPDLSITRVPPKTLEKFKKLAHEEFNDDWGFTLKFLVDGIIDVEVQQLAFMIQALEGRIAKLEKDFAQPLQLQPKRIMTFGAKKELLLEEKKKEEEKKGE